MTCCSHTKTRTAPRLHLSNKPFQPVYAPKRFNWIKRRKLRRTAKGGDERQVSDLALKRLMHIFTIAISAFNKSLIAGNLQPDARMPQPPFATVTGDTPSIHNTGFGRLDAHGARSLGVKPVCAPIWRVGAKGARPSIPINPWPITDIAHRLVVMKRNFEVFKPFNSAGPLNTVQEQLTVVDEKGSPRPSQQLKGPKPKNQQQSRHAT